MNNLAKETATESLIRTAITQCTDYWNDLCTRVHLKDEILVCFSILLCETQSARGFQRRFSTATIRFNGLLPASREGWKWLGILVRKAGSSHKSWEVPQNGQLQDWDIGRVGAAWRRKCTGHVVDIGSICGRTDDEKSRWSRKSVLVDDDKTSVLKFSNEWHHTPLNIGVSSSLKHPLSPNRSTLLSIYIGSKSN